MRRAATVAGALAAVLALAGCDVPWSSPQGPLTAGGARLDDGGDLEFWLGAPCDAVGEIRVELSEAGGDGRVLDTWILRSEDAGGATLEHLTLGTVPDGFGERNALERDWRDAETVSFRVTAADPDDAAATHENEADAAGQPLYPDVPASAYVSVGSFTEQADDRRDEWYVQDQGWFTEEEYRALAGDDDMIYPFCDVPGH